MREHRSQPPRQETGAEEAVYPRSAPRWGRSCSCSQEDRQDGPRKGSVSASESQPPFQGRWLCPHPLTQDAMTKCLYLLWELSWYSSSTARALCRKAPTTTQTLSSSSFLHMHSSLLWGTAYGIYLLGCTCIYHIHSHWL